MSPIKHTKPVIFLLLVAGVCVAALLYFRQSFATGPGLTAAAGAAAQASSTDSCAASLDRVARLTPLMTGEIAALAGVRAPLAFSGYTFSDGAGNPLEMEKDFAGKLVLFNLWATWCGPCRREMPALDRLQAELGSEAFEVVTVNLDQGDAEKGKRFFADLKLNSLNYYADPSLGVLNRAKRMGLARGLPATILVDENSCVLAAMAGPAEWHSADAMALIKAALAMQGTGAVK